MTPRNAAKASPHHTPPPRGAKRGSDTPRPETPLKSTLLRHPPLSDRDREILALCEARRRELRLSVREVGRRVDVDHADVSRALALKSATRRTLLALARYFEISGVEEAARGLREQALFLELAANANRQADLLSALALLRSGDPPL